MDKEKENRICLTYGRQSTEYEDGIVGNEAGLMELASSIQQALETGRSSKEIDEFGIVFLKPDEFFPPEESKELGLLGKTVLTVVLLSILALIVIGVGTVFSWVF